jgi:hypothetical protein
MRLERIALFPGDAVATEVTSVGSQIKPVRLAHRWDEFSKALGEWTSAEVAIEDVAEMGIPSEGTFYVCRPDVFERSLASQSNHARDLTSHTIVVDIPRTYALDWAERLQLAATLDTDRYSRWLDGGKERTPSELYGRKDVGQAWGATLSELPFFHTEHYALLSDPKHAHLPALLARYLEECARFL